MFKKSSFLSCIYFLLLCSAAFAQSPVSVSPLTGAVNVNIPIYTINSGQVSLPVSLWYNSSGIKPTDVEGTCGIGWQLNAGGQISRQVRGLPDDVSADMSGNSRYGWMSTSNTAANNIASFTIQNDGGVTCSKETADITNINTDFPYNFDTEPDMFSVSAPGLSCQMVYDRATAKFHPVNYQDIVITFVTDPSDGFIDSFTITNDKGISYVFAAPAIAGQTATGGSSSSYFATKYKQYQYGILYYNSWNLVNITDANGNGVILDYTAVPARAGSDPVSVYLPGATTATGSYSVELSVTSQLLSDIQTTNAIGTNTVFTFGFFNTLGVLGTTRGTGQSLIGTITGMGHSFTLGYTKMSTSGGSYDKFFLRSLNDAGCNSPVGYTFAYAKENLTNNTTILPDSGTYNVDYWGYFANNSATSLQPKISVNPSNASYQRYQNYASTNSTTVFPYTTTTGNSRISDPTNFDAGTLNGITYAQGGTTTIVYERNVYVDPSSGSEVSGGGNRVKQITDNDNTNPAMVRNYSYIDPTTGLNSGKPISLPVFAFTIPYSGTATGSALWNANTVTSAYDLSNEDHTILYKYFKLSQTGLGSTLYQFYVPATNWDIGATPGCAGCTTAEWAPTVNDVARANCASTYGPVKNGTYSYPFIPNPNYDFERGLLKQEIDYNDAGTKISESDYTYQRSVSPSAIIAFKYDDDSNGTLSVRAYNKYITYYNTSELKASVVKSVYGAPTAGTAQTSTINYTYGSAHHKLLTKQSVANSDNSVITSNITYTKDYTAAAGSNANVNAIYYLQQHNINIPVETWQQVTKSGVTKTTGANLNLFKAFTTAYGTVLYLPAQQRKMVQPDGTTAFTQYTISGQTSTPDSKYFPVANFDSYDVTGYPVTVDNANNHVQTAILDHVTNHTTATFDNAAYNEIGFTDFDTDPNAPTPSANSFTISGSSSFTPNGSHAGNAYGFGVGQTMSVTVTKNATAKNYIFSIWINAVTSGTLTLTLSSGSPATYSFTYATGGWKYYEKSIPVASVASGFTISAAASTAISVDDVLFYPSTAQASTASYDPLTHVQTSATNTNGVSSYMQSDQWGRLLYRYDQDKNIVEKKSYFTSTTQSEGQGQLQVQYTSLNATIPVNFTASVSCVAGVAYAWNFGDGTTIPSTVNAANEIHTYTASGTYTLTVTATHPSFGTQTFSNPITLLPPAITASLCISGVNIWNSCTGTAINTVHCDPNPYSTTATYYTVTFTGTVVGTVTYQWQMSYDGGSTWTNVGSNTNQYSISHGDGDTGYQIKCVITTSGGQHTTSSTSIFTPRQC